MLMRLEHLVLFLGGKPGEQRHDLDRVGPTHVGRARAVMMTQRILELMDVALAGRKHENIAWATVMGGMNHQFGARPGHCGRHIHVDVASGILRGIRRGRQLLVIRISRHGSGLETGDGTHQCGRGAKRLIHDLHGVGASRHLDYRDLSMQGVLEMLLELHRIDRRRRDDELQVTTFGQQGRKISKQKIDVETALMGLVYHNRVVLHELRVALDLCEQNTVGHHAKPRLRRAFVGEPNLVAYLFTQTNAHLVRDAFGHGAGGKPARLRMHDLPAMRSSAQFQQDLRQLRGLAGTGLTGNNHHLARLDGIRDVVMGRGNRQLGGIFEFHALTTSITRKPFELAYLPTA